MKTYAFTLKIQATDQGAATQILQAVAVLATRLTPHEIQKLAHIVEHDPQKTALAKKALGV